MIEWREVDLDNAGPWSAWHVQICLGTMPDGTVAPMGLRIEPRDDYRGSTRDQRITLDRLRQFPLGWATVSARIGSHGAQPTPEEFGLIEQLLDESISESRDAHAQQERRSLARKLRAYAEKPVTGEAAILKQYRDRGLTDRQIRLHIVASHYKQAQLLPEVSSPRRFVAEKLVISLTTVDRLLREARQEGYLPPYDGGQGKHGKTVPAGPQRSPQGAPKAGRKSSRRRKRAAATQRYAAPGYSNGIQRSAKGIDREDDQRGK